MASYSPAPRFRSAWLKVQRANRHIDELKGVLDVIDVRRFYSIRVHGYEGGPTTVILEPQNPIPDTLPLMVGDAVHNLRTSLDHLFSEVVGERLPLKERLFPFSKERPKVESLGKRFDAVEQALPGSQEVILDEVQPYEGGQGNLYGLHRLDRIDKHNELIVTAAGAVLGKLELLTKGRVFATFDRCIFNAEEPTVLYAGPDHVTLEHNFEATLLICFHQALPFGNEAVIPTLQNLSQRVSEVIKRFEAL